MPKRTRVHLATATQPRKVREQDALDHPHLFFNRELSWLDFCARVLALAFDERNPLLERVRYLSYASEHLDEFFSKRVGGLKRQKMAGVRALSPDGRAPQQQLGLIRRAALPLYRELHRAWEDVLEPALRADSPIRILNYEDLDTRDKKTLQALFQEHIFPMLTPLAVDPSHPFPFISNLSISLAILLRHPVRGTPHFARMKVPRESGRWVPLGDSLAFVPLEQVITNNLTNLFRGMEILGTHAFRVTRNANLARHEEEADDLIASIADELRERRFAPVVRLEVERTIPQQVREFLMQRLVLSSADVYEGGRVIDLSDCFYFSTLDAPTLRYKALHPVVPAAFTPARDVFASIREQDRLVHHPYDSFAHSVRSFITTAAHDPDVIAIKHTLYRTNEDSLILTALIAAAQSGKQVTVVIEVKARYDEERNITWAQRLEKSGVEVNYGPTGLKTHAKATLVLRKETGHLRSYSHIATGNYNTDTADCYADVGLFTCDPAIGADLSKLFHYLTGYAPDQEYRTLLVSPRQLRTAFTTLIDREITHQQSQGGRIIATMTGLDDVDMIKHLYRASQANVTIDLIVRGHCRLRPGLPFHSPTIRVMSVVGRFLEDLRVFYFGGGGNPEVYIGSADWMRRNLDERVELVVPVQSPILKDRLIRILQVMLSEQRHAWDLRSTGAYVQRALSGDSLYTLLRQEAAKASV